MKKIVAFLLVISILVSVSAVVGCQVDTPSDDAYEGIISINDDSPDVQYLIFQLTNTHYKEAEGYVAEMTTLYGPVNAQSERMWAFGLVGPMTLTQSVEEMREVINTGFDIAEKYNVPVYFQMDDCTAYTESFGNGAAKKFYEDPFMSEWIRFPTDGEVWGGESYGMLPRYWYNWGQWRTTKAFPNFMSESFRELMRTNIEEGILKPLTYRYAKLLEQGKGYLYAGMAIGWETNIPTVKQNITSSNLPKCSLTGDTMKTWELSQYGYAALYTLGYDDELLAAEARKEGMTVMRYTQELLYGVIQNYSEFLSKLFYDTGIPRRKIFTHIVASSSVEEANTSAPPIWTAVNPYATPGFTMSPLTCPYDVDVIMSEIRRKDNACYEYANSEGYGVGLLNTVEEFDAYFGELFGGNCRNITVFGYTDPATSKFYFKKSLDNAFVISANKWLDYQILEDYKWESRFDYGTDEV